MEYVALTIATVVLTLCLHFFHIVGFARRILVASGNAVATMRVPGLTDEQREIAVQRASIGVAIALASLLARVAGSFLLAFAIVYLGSAIGAYSLDALMLAAENWYFIAGSALLVVAAMIFMR